MFQGKKLWPAAGRPKTRLIFLEGKKKLIECLFNSIIFWVDFFWWVTAATVTKEKNLIDFFFYSIIFWVYFLVGDSKEKS